MDPDGNTSWRERYAYVTHPNFNELPKYWISTLANHIAPPSISHEKQLYEKIMNRVRNVPRSAIQLTRAFIRGEERIVGVHRPSRLALNQDQVRVAQLLRDGGRLSDPFDLQIAKNLIMLPQFQAFPEVVFQKYSGSGGASSSAQNIPEGDKSLDWVDRWLAASNRKGLPLPSSKEK